MAGSGVKGDFRKLAKLITAAGRVASMALVQENLKTMGSVSHQLAQRGAAAGQNPQGRAWKPLKRGGRALSGAAGSLHLQVTSTGFKIESSQSWLRIHQRGAKKRGTKWRLPARRILPKKALPKSWETPIVEAVRAEWAAEFGK